MDINGIKNIESALGVKLPAYYVELVTNYPPELLETEAPDFGLLDSPNVIIDENKSVRTGAFYGGQWPAHLFIIGTNGCGDYYVTKLNDEKFSTGFFDHETPAFFPYSKSRSEFIEKLLSEQGDAVA
ncbi:SMI1/KNR4 family protein [Methylobacillus flagellatus]|uniref:SMI1/KNR4 family protein n=1 Tax=Methylobacillus flagellatus TaxID=405 RepID=UPI0010F7B001|nr:SMI1/KNR4 family protein [Methylobacillus flagellatus]